MSGLLFICTYFPMCVSCEEMFKMSDYWNVLYIVLMLGCCCGALAFYAKHSRKSSRAQQTAEQISSTSRTENCQFSKISGSFGNTHVARYYQARVDITKEQCVCFEIRTIIKAEEAIKSSPEIEKEEISTVEETKKVSSSLTSCENVTDSKVDSSASKAETESEPTEHSQFSKIKVDKSEQEQPQQQFKPTRTQLMPFSFEQRDKQLMKKKEEFINRVLLEEEKKSREFHAKPLPKAILRSKNFSRELISDAGSIKSFKYSAEDLSSTVFKAKPAKVLKMKPFEPKKDENHILKVEAFHFNTDHRLEARKKFEEKIKEKEAVAEAHHKQREELLKKLQEEEVAKLRKQMEHKAQPIKKYKKVEIHSANKVTEPVSSKCYTRKLRNKENIQQ